MQSCPSVEQDELVLVILTPFLDRSDLGWRASETLYILNKPHKHRRFKREREFPQLTCEMRERINVGNPHSFLALIEDEANLGWRRQRDILILNNPHKH